MRRSVDSQRRRPSLFLQKVLCQLQVVDAFHMENNYIVVQDVIITSPAVPNVLPTPRFGRVEEQRIGDLFDGRHSTNTKRNTSWAIKIFIGMLVRSI